MVTRRVFVAGALIELEPQDTRPIKACNSYTGVVGNAEKWLAVSEMACRKTR